jgi:hypothetical protein
MLRLHCSQSYISKKIYSNTLSSVIIDLFVRHCQNLIIFSYVNGF